jgi:cbb3-type cytochrome oxidase subunit 3
MTWLALIDRLHAPLSLVMLVLFCAIVAWAYSPHRRRSMDESARIPLRDDG